MPVLEYERKCKYIDEYGISYIDASTLTKERSYLTILKVLLVTVLILRKLLM